MDPFEFATPEEKRVYAEEKFRIDVQHAIHKLMRHGGVSKKDLAKRLGVSAPRVTHLLGDGTNMTLRTVAAIFHVLGDECGIHSRALDLGAPSRSLSWSARAPLPRSRRRMDWNLGTVGEARSPGPEAAQGSSTIASATA